MSRAELRLARRMLLANQRLERATKQINRAWRMINGGAMRTFWKTFDEQQKREAAK